MVDLAAGGKDVNSVAADALGLLVKSPGVAILLSTFAKMTLDIMQTPVKEFFEELRNDYIKKLNVYKFSGISAVINYLLQEKSRTKLLNEFKIQYISYQSMQKLLNGIVRKWDDIEYANEVTILYIDKGDYSIIDSFFIKTSEI